MASKNQTTTTSTSTADPLAAFKKSLPEPKSILNPPPPAPQLADPVAPEISPEVERYVGCYCRWNDDSLNAPNRFIFVQNAFPSAKGDPKFLTKENCVEEMEEKLAVSHVLFEVSLAVDKKTRIVTEHHFRDENVAGGVVFIPAKAFIEQAQISVDGNLLGMEAEKHRRAQMNATAMAN